MIRAFPISRPRKETLRAARDSVRLFGKTDEEIDRIVADRKADPTLVVPSPIDGRITARNAAPGLFVQPGSAPAPYTMANIDTMWMLANVAENDSPAFQVGQAVQVNISAFPGRLFDGKITTVGSVVDPNTRRVLVRSEIKDPQHELRSGMFANFLISVGTPVRSPAVPLNGVVREGDGTPDDLGHRRPPALRQADGEDRRSARRLPPNPRRRASGRTGRHRGRDLSQQYAGHRKRAMSPPQATSR